MFPCGRLVIYWVEKTYACVMMRMHSGSKDLRHTPGLSHLISRNSFFLFVYFLCFMRDRSWHKLFALFDCHANSVFFCRRGWIIFRREEKQRLRLSTEFQEEFISLNKASGKKKTLKWSLSYLRDLIPSETRTAEN